MVDGIQRRPAAKFSAHVVGYSRFMGIDEASTLRHLSSRHAEIIDELIEEHGGRIVKTTGDGLPQEIPSVVAAVECIVAVQECMIVRNADTEDDEAIRFRAAVLGRIIFRLSEDSRFRHRFQSHIVEKEGHK